MLYIPNPVVEAGFDGWATVVAALGSLVTFVTLVMAEPPPAKAQMPATARPAHARAQMPAKARPAHAKVANPTWLRSGRAM